MKNPKIKIGEFAVNSTNYLQRGKVIAEEFRKHPDGTKYRCLQIITSKGKKVLDNEVYFFKGKKEDFTKQEWLHFFPEQPQHTQGKYRTTHNDAHSDTGSTAGRDWQQPIIVNYKGIVAMAHGSTRIEATSNANRIVKAVNMYEELISELKKVNKRLCDISHEDSKTMRVKMEIADSIEQLLKQTE